MKAIRECEERNCAAYLHVFLQKKYVAKAKCKDKDAECTSELEGEEHGEKANMVDTNIEIKVEEEFLAGIHHHHVALPAQISPTISHHPSI